MIAVPTRTGCWSSQRAGFTLVELLVATAITLLLVAALTQAFSIVGTSVTAHRAGLEMAGQMRGVGIRLQTDLERVTLPVKPWPDPSSAFGYFETTEGWDHDGSPYLIGNTSFGDNDDVLMFTSRSDDEPFLGLFTNYVAAVPTPVTIHSNLAEIAWWTTLADHANTDTDGDGISDVGNGSIDPDQGEDFTVYRRVLLIRPSLGTVAQLPRPTSSNPNPTYNVTSQTDLQGLFAALRQFYLENDISVRIVRNFVPSGSNNLQVFLVANSLQDVTKRENRFAHSRIVAGNPGGSGLRYFSAQFPHHLDRDATSATSLPMVRTPIAQTPFAEPGLIKSGLYQGEDVVMAHASAFDVRVYDPMAIVAAYPGEDDAWGVVGVNDDGVGGTDDVAEAGWPGSDDEAVVPGDPGFAIPGAKGSVRLVDHPTTGTILRSMHPIGRGAFVDLYYTVKRHHDANAAASYPNGDYSYNKIDGLSNTSRLPSPPHPSSTNSSSETTSTPSGLYYSHFSNAPRIAASGQGNVGIWPTLSATARPLATYDTWSFHYETDGDDQDGDGTVDQGTDGLDSDAANGVDDPGERETSPPYNVPLRGIQVRIRMIEQDTRQVRQITVESDFTPE